MPKFCLLAVVLRRGLLEECRCRAVESVPENVACSALAGTESSTCCQSKWWPICPVGSLSRGSTQCINNDN
ncbi:hypothetical protein TNCV_3345511 [Trichonephila clavipes]|nr:hypothetical protein TNCV_3345511 [Trichonephila clavipes]